jgi:deoxyribodipyrimidine photo-lyase
MADGPFIYRFSKDLRLDDHAGLAAAASRSAVLPLLVIDAALRARLQISPRRAAFFCAAVAALDAELRERGSRLVVIRSEAVDAIRSLARETGAFGAAWSASYDRAGIQCDRQLQSQLEEDGLGAVIVHDAPAIGPEETAEARSGGGPAYRAFAPYFDAWLKLPIASHEQPLLLRFTAPDGAGEPLPDPEELGASDGGAVAGPPAARKLFEGFLREGALQYAAAATAPGDDRTSHLSAHLSFGTIAARTVARRVRERLMDPFALSEERLSLRLFLRALAHRDFFLQLSWFYPWTHDEPLQEKMHGFTWTRKHSALESWRNGTTGFPLVDAGIRQLRATGWMHSHVRAVAASFLCFDFGVDWRVGRAEWDRWLIEDDGALATGNWQWIAGIGADMARYPRIYNPERQRRRYDPAGIYVRRWVDELRNVPMETWFGREMEQPQLRLGLFAADRYPKPAVDHATAARAFLRRYREFVSP